MQYFRAIKPRRMRLVGNATSPNKRNAYRVLARKPDKGTWNKQTWLEDTIKMCTPKVRWLVSFGLISFRTATSGGLL
jgi:hypothetical protein